MSHIFCIYISANYDKIFLAFGPRVLVIVERQKEKIIESLITNHGELF
jgi:hypothetical protein